jgi:hypothetical protein
MLPALIGAAVGFYIGSRGMEMAQEARVRAERLAQTQTMQAEEALLEKERSDEQRERFVVFHTSRLK